MLRHSLTRLVGSAATPRTLRPLSTSSTLLEKIRNNTVNPSQPDGLPSPAERPPPIPDSISTPPESFEPIINHPSPVIPPSAADIEETIPQSQTPLTPPPPPETVPATASVEDHDLSKLPSLDIEPLEALPEPEKESGGQGENRQRTGAKGKEYVTSIERQRRMLGRVGLGLLVVGGIGAVYYVGQKDGGVNADGSNSASGPWNTFKANMSEISDYFNKPAFKTLLPDPLPPPHQRPYTLVIDLEGLLVSSSWDRQSGWRTAKRPGVDYFLAYLSQFYEIVLFTSQPLYTAAPVAEKLDPFQAYLPYKLFRESTRYVNGKVVKDLSYLNRDLSKVILLDTNPEHAALQPENAIIVKPWEGKGGDKGLVDMIPFLESIGIFNPPDVRPILKAYEGKDIPVEYAKKEAEAKRLAIEDWERKHPTSMSGGGVGYLSGMFGGVAGQPGQTRPNQPMTYLESKRAQAQKMYQEEQKYWKDNAEEFKKLIEEDKQKQMAEMKGSLLGFMTGGPGGGVKKPEEVGK